MPILNGILPIKKASGVTSKTIGRLLDKALKAKFSKTKIGHLGTLDPMASGVLPIMLGSANRLFDLLIHNPKTYEFTIALGYETDSLDKTGEITKTAKIPPLTPDLVNQAMLIFYGGYEQVPPLYSAIKFKGKPLYEYAREKKELDFKLGEIKRKFVRIYHLELLDFCPDTIKLSACCGSGTYVRSLARDLAYNLGTIGTVTELKRTSAGGIELENCLEIDDLLSDIEKIADHMILIPQLPLGIPHLKIFDAQIVKKLKNGAFLNFSEKDFANSVKISNNTINRNKEQSLPDTSYAVLFFEDDNRAFALGNVSLSSNNEFTIKMTRGLA